MPSESRTLPLPAAALAGDPLRFEGPRLLLYRLLDVADEIDLDEAERLLAGAATRLRLSRARSRYLEIPRAPLTVFLGPREVAAGGDRAFTAQAQARLFSFGALSVRYEIVLPPLTDSRAAALLLRDFEESPSIEGAARNEVGRLCERLRPTLEGPHAWDGMETYAVLLARGVQGPSPASALGVDPRIARILLSEVAEEPLTAEEVRDATQHRFSYAENDLCVIDWNAAVVIEPDESSDIPDVLEFATAQLLEFRFYDDLVDREMDSLYDILTKARDPLRWQLGGRYRRLGRQLNRRLIETVEFMERVDNALKVIADTYLARIYLAAINCFRVPAWQAGVQRKQDLTRQVAEVLLSESQTSTSHLLEVIIIFLILYEILAPLLWRAAG